MKRSLTYHPLQLSLLESLCGFRRLVKTLDGRSLVVEHPAGETLPDGAEKTILAEGMPAFRNPYVRGNLRVNIKVRTLALMRTLSINEINHI